MKKGSIIIRYRDDDTGIDDKAFKLLFEIFYTKKRGEGCIFLGTHSVVSAING